MGGRAAWFVALPLVAVGWLTAHALAYVLVAPNGQHRAQLLAETGHGYLGAAPILVAFAATLLICGFGVAVVDRVRGAAGRRLPLWPVALVAPLGFAVQEHLERLIELQALPVGAALEPSFLVGVVLQIPFAVAALLVARCILEFGDVVGGALVATPAPRPVGFAVAPRRFWRYAPALGPRAVLSTGHAERAPPLRRA